MEKRNTSTTSGGIGFSGVLTIIFVVLKMCGLIDWSWGWVLAPLWMPIVLILAFVFAITLKGIIVKKRDKE